MCTLRTTRASPFELFVLRVFPQSPKSSIQVPGFGHGYFVDDPQADTRLGHVAPFLWQDLTPIFCTFGNQVVVLIGLVAYNEHAFVFVQGLTVRKNRAQNYRG